MVRILLVEDNAAVLESISLELELHNYTVLLAENGIQALKILETLTLPDIIISDIAMPEMDGYELLEQVQKNPVWTSIPFLFLTAYGSEADIRRGKQYGVDDYLVKPFRPEDLIIAIENKLRRVNQLRMGAERQLDQVRTDLLLLISHELRTPLTSIYGGAELLALNLENVPDDTSVAALRIVRAGARRMQRLINQVMYLIQIDSGSLKREYDARNGTCDLQEVVGTAYQYLQQDHPRHDVELVLNVPEEPVYVKGLYDALLTAFSEVLRNAITFSHPNSQIVVTIQRQGNMAETIVEDFGKGIAEEDLSAVWERFRQSNRRQQEQQGVGLGLALVRDTILLHQGECSLYSQLNSGTQVVLRLPLAIGADFA